MKLNILLRIILHVGYTSTIGIHHMHIHGMYIEYTRLLPMETNLCHAMLRSFKSTCFHYFSTRVEEKVI